MSPLPTYLPAAFPQGMLAGSWGWGPASGLVEGSKCGGCPPQGTGLLSAGKSWRLVLSFQRAEMGRYTRRGVGRRRGGRSLRRVPSAFLWVWVRGGCSTCTDTSVPNPIWPRSHWESRERTRERDHKRQLLRKPVSGKKPAMRLTCPDAFSLPTCLPALAGWRRHRMGTAEVTSQLCAVLDIARSC